MNETQAKLLELAKKRDISQLSFRQIAKFIDVKNAETVRYHLLRLKDKGIKLKPEKGLISKHSGLRLISIPIVGAANCGPATIFADERIEDSLKISLSLLRANNYKDLYALKAQGKSMNKASVNGLPINNGDFVLVDSSKRQPSDGDYVVAVYGGMANIKKIHQDIVNNQVVLYSESSEVYPPIYLHEDDNTDALISGKVIQVINQPLGVK